MDFTASALVHSDKKNEPKLKSNREMNSLIKSAKESKVIRECVQKVNTKRKLGIGKNKELANEKCGFRSLKRSKSLGAMSCKSSSEGEGVLLKINKRRFSHPTSEYIIENGLSTTMIKGPLASKDKKTNIKDPYCWRCHEFVSEMVSCSLCPRSYHYKCLRSKPPEFSSWACPECMTVMHSENIDSRSSAMKEVSVESLSKLLMYALNNMLKIPEVNTFIEPINENEHPEYFEYIVEPMFLNKLRDKIANKVYGSTLAFLMDCKWILHNSIIYNTAQAKVTNVAKSIVNVCKQEVKEIEICPQCYLNVNTNSENWFTEVCDVPHILLWVKIKGFPFWPAKGMNYSLYGKVEVKFFGAHDKSSVFLKDCYLYSTKQPNTSYRPKKSEKLLLEALKELDIHITHLKLKFGSFVPAPFKSRYQPENHTIQLESMIPALKNMKLNCSTDIFKFSNIKDVPSSCSPKVSADNMQPVIILHNIDIPFDKKGRSDDMETEVEKVKKCNLKNIQNNTKSFFPLITTALNNENKINTINEISRKRNYPTDDSDIFCDTLPEKSMRPNIISEDFPESFDTLYNLALEKRKSKQICNKVEAPCLKTYSRKTPVKTQKDSNSTNINSKNNHIKDFIENSRVIESKEKNETTHPNKNPLCESDNILLKDSVVTEIRKSPTKPFPKIIEIHSLAYSSPNKMNRNKIIQDSDSNPDIILPSILPQKSDLIKSSNKLVVSTEIQKTPIRHERNAIIKPNLSFDYTENVKRQPNEIDKTTVEENPAFPNVTENNDRLDASGFSVTDNENYLNMNSAELSVDPTLISNSITSQIGNRELDSVILNHNQILKPLKDKTNDFFDYLCYNMPTSESLRINLTENITGLFDNICKIISNSGNSSTTESNYDTLNAEYHKLKFKNEQEKLEMQHNTGLVMAEMRFNMELENEKALKQFQYKAYLDKICTADAKSQRWCSYCKIETKQQWCENILHCSSKSCQQAYQKQKQSQPEAISIETAP